VIKRYAGRLNSVGIPQDCSLETDAATATTFDLHCLIPTWLDATAKKALGKGNSNLPLPANRVLASKKTQVMRETNPILMLGQHAHGCESCSQPFRRCPLLPVMVIGKHEMR